MSEKLYSILMYNFNNYEIMREPEEMDPECEYLYITDDPKLKSNKWKIIVDHDLDGLSPFDKCYRVRFNLFKYATTPVCIYVDGSIQIHKSLRKLYNDFMKSECDIGLNIHPECDNVYEEYLRWLRLRGYSPYQMGKCLCMFQAAGWNPQDKGLYQGTCRICKNTSLNKSIDDFVFNTLVKLGTNGIIERLDQTIYSFVINKFFDKIKIFGFSQQVLQSKYMSWCLHKTTRIIPYNRYNDKEKGFILGKLKKTYKI
ncbi:MAG TPA: hypothetical protein PLC00_06110 [Bacteroidales bacterium]|nr:hypothetical protein [Bacteroidales bacterium]